jgi:hypothetical protein
VRNSEECCVAHDFLNARFLKQIVKVHLFLYMNIYIYIYMWSIE